MAMATSHIKDCLHDPIYVVEDIHEGVSVCTRCSLVVNSQCYGEEFIGNQNSLDISYQPNISYPYEPLFCEIKDICINHHIPDYIAQKCLEIYSETNKILQSKKCNFPKETVAAYAIYKGMQVENYSRSNRELYSMTGITMQQIWNVESKIDHSVMQIPKVEDFLDRFGAFCNLNFNDIKKIKEKAWIASEICHSHAPPNVAAALIYIHHNSNLSVQAISELCLVSNSSIHKIVRILNESTEFVN
jgi:transcription initiation factor TFIIIB Brf1 subunit/transcription initiation factor TFIIB